jgi:hypothetical protein
MIVPRSVEFDDVGVDEDALAAIARETGGRYLRGTDPGLADAVRHLSTTPREVVGPRLELWGHPASLALVLVLLGVEWYLRKRWGLV